MTGSSTDGKLAKRCCTPRFLYGREVNIIPTPQAVYLLPVRSIPMETQSTINMTTIPHWRHEGSRGGGAKNCLSNFQIQRPNSNLDDPQ